MVGVCRRGSRAVLAGSPALAVDPRAVARSLAMVVGRSSQACVVSRQRRGLAARPWPPAPGCRPRSPSPRDARSDEGVPAGMVLPMAIRAGIQHRHQRRHHAGSGAAPAAVRHPEGLGRGDAEPWAIGAEHAQRERRRADQAIGLDGRPRADGTHHAAAVHLLRYHAGHGDVPALQDRRPRLGQAAVAVRCRAEAHLHAMIKAPGQGLIGERHPLRLPRCGALQATLGNSGLFHVGAPARTWDRWDQRA